MKPADEQWQDATRQANRLARERRDIHIEIVRALESVAILMAQIERNGIPNKHDLEMLQQRVGRLSNKTQP